MISTLPRASRRSRFLFDWDYRYCLASPDGALDAITGQVATYSRGGTPGTATAVDGNGRVYVAGASRPRFHHQYNAATGLWDAAGFVFEGQRKNLVLQPEDLTNATGGWSTSTVTATKSYAAAAGMSFSRLSAIVDASFCNRSVTLTGDGTKSFRVFVRGDGVNGTGRATLYDSTAAVRRAQVKYTVTNGVVAFVAENGTLLATEVMGDSVYCALMQAPGCVAANTNVYYPLANGLGNTLTSVQMVAGNVEDAAFPSRYIPQAASALTRSADAASFTLNMPPIACTFYAKVICLDDISQNLFSLSNGGANPRLLMTNDGNHHWEWYYHNGSDAEPVHATATPNIGDLVELRAILFANGTTQLGQSINGAAEVVTAVGLPPSSGPLLPAAWSGQTLYVGSTGGAGQSQAAWQSLRVAAGSQSLAYMQAG